MPATKLPFHADHIGSLIRPEYVSQAQERADAGEISPAELRSTQQKAISDIVAKQKAHHVHALCSGEFDRKYYFSGFFEKLEGFKEVSPVPWDLARLSAAPIAALKKAGKQYPMAAICDGKIEYRESPYLDNWKLLRACVPKEEWGQCKFTMPRRATSIYGWRRARPTRRRYRRPDVGVLLLGRHAGRAAGGRRRHGRDVPDVPEGAQRLHRRPAGGHARRTPHLQSYEKIAAQFFQTLDYDTFYLEYDDPRSGGFAPLRFLPAHKNVVLGVVTTKDPRLEDAGVLARRVREAAAVIAAGQGRSVAAAMQQIGISPQCGFASVAVGADGMTEERMFAKLRLVQEVARELWPDRA
nr:uncharacterized protein yxjh [Quercus suber]